MKLPIAGYTGHRKGLKAENVYAKNFRDSTINAEKKLRLQKTIHCNFRANWVIYKIYETI